MENVIRSRTKRSFVRRLFSRKVLAPVASLALLSGGGWGAYQYYGSEQFAETLPPELVQVAHSAASAKEELKMLFAAEEPPTAKKQPKMLAAPKKKTAPLSKIDRYASVKVEPTKLPLAPPPLPPLVEQPTPYQQPASGNAADSSPARPVLGDRYATALTTPPTPAAVEQAPTRNELANDDIARGQEPGTNPLRTIASPSASSDRDARAAFSNASKPSPPASTNPFTNVPPKTKGMDQLASALQNARPLPSSQPPQNQSPSLSAVDRYRTAPSTPATMSAPAPQTAPSTALAQQRPAPPLDIPVQRAPIQQNPQALPTTSPALGAPPAGLSTHRAPASAPLNSPPMLANLGNAAANITPTPGLVNHPGTGRPGERLLEGAQSPAITIQKLAPEEIQVGKRCTFAIRIQNSGQRTAQNVQIHDEIPLGTELVGTAPRATVSGSQIVWNLGTLSPGEERTVEMELMPKEEGELGSVAMVTLSAQASAKSRCTRPELALRLTSKPQVHVGQQQVVQIEVSNPGSGNATGVMLLETVPTGVSHEAGPALEFEIGTLRAGESKRLELLLTAEQAGKISNVMTARADASLQVEASCDFEVIAPDLQLSVEGPQRRFLERPATYRVSVDNPGTASAKDIQLVTHLPKGMQFVSANNMGEYDSSTHSVHWSLAELPANERGTVELIALPIEPGEQTLQVATQAKQGLEDRTDKQVMVEGLSALMFEVIDVEGLIEIGGETTYEIRVQNQGSKAASNVQIVAIMPAGIRPVTGQGETRHAIQGERVIFAPLPQLAPKAETTFRIQAQGIRPGDQRVRVQITSDDTQLPITKEVSTRVYADE